MTPCAIKKVLNAKSSRLRVIYCKMGNRWSRDSLCKFSASGKSCLPFERELAQLVLCLSLPRDVLAQETEEAKWIQGLELMSQVLEPLGTVDRAWHEWVKAEDYALFKRQIGQDSWRMLRSAIGI